MKQLEGEKDVLLQGLEVVEHSREWYMKQIAIVTEKQSHAEKTSCSVSLKTMIIFKYKSIKHSVLAYCIVRWFVLITLKFFFLNI